MGKLTVPRSAIPAPHWPGVESDQKNRSGHADVLLHCAAWRVLR